jgi:hypothetical protein
VVAAPPAHAGLDAESFPALAERRVKAGPARRWEYCHHGLTHKEATEKYYSALSP